MIKENRVGESIFQTSCNMNATIIRYGGARDVDVKFEDERIRTSVEYAQFKKGKLWPSLDYRTELLQQVKQQRTGTRRKMSSGLWAYICEYRNSCDVDVCFEIDNAVAKNKHWKDFLNGKIAHPSIAPNYDRNVHIGEKRTMNNGLVAEIIAFRTTKDIDIKFENDGVVVTKKQYNCFLEGRISHPNIKTIFEVSLQEFAIRYYLKPLGFVKIEKGEWKERGFGGFELDFYHPKHKVAIEFDGSIHGKTGALDRDLRKNLACQKLGITIYRLRDPYLPSLNDGISIDYILKPEKRMSKNLLIDCKTELEEILRGQKINFDNDFIDFHRDLSQIFTDYQAICVNQRHEKYVGEKSFCYGAQQYMTIVKYHNTKNVDIVFDDGTPKSGVRYGAFRKGHVLHPNFTRSEIIKRISINKKNKKGDKICG